MASLPRINKLFSTAQDIGIEVRTGIVLILTFFLSLFLSSYFIIGVAIKGHYAVSGGSDAYYNMRIIQYILSTHHQLLFDPQLNYPIGLENPRPPFFHWFAVLLGYAFSPFLGGVYASTMTMFLMSTAIGGALIVFPTYFLGKELFGRKVGIIGAILVALSPLTMMKSIATIGLFDIFTALFGLMFIYYYLRAVNTFNFVLGDYGSFSNIASTLRKNQLSIIYALLAAVSLAASMLTWDGSISLVLILAGAGLVQLFIYAIRKKSALSIFIATLFFGAGFIIAFPWYYVAGFIAVRFDYPLIIWGALLISSIYFILLERKPWVFSISLYIIVAVAAIALIDKVNPNIIQSILSGQHYFIKNKIYTTIAEAQALPLGEDIMEFGPIQFFASIIGIGALIYYWIKRKDFNMTLALLYFAGIIFISMIASKFLYFGATAISILTGFVLVKVFEMLQFKDVIEKSKDRPVKHVLRKELKFAHYATILIVVFLLVVPTTFYAVDSGIPFNNKTTYDREIYNATPSILRPQNYTPPYYLGAFGVSLDLPNSPWVRALDWFKNQDTSQPPADRPAFVSWWDYGFQTLEQGDHPVMADNFQDGIFPAAQILMAQNESQIVSIFISRILDYYVANHDLNNATIDSIISQYLGNGAIQNITNYELNGSNLISQIYSNPKYYGPREGIQAGDAKYILMEGYLSNTFPLSTLINLNTALVQATGFNMSYIAVDYRLFPFSGINTGIFYAPAYLGDFPYVDVQGEIVPTTFFNITVTDTSGNTYALQNFPPGDTAVNYSINYLPMFYNSTIYRMFIGYPPSVAGVSSGIPGITSNMQYYIPMQAWGEPNFELAYKTVFWNPYTDYQNHSNAWQPVSLEQGYYYLKHKIGTVDLTPPASQVLPSDVVFVQYFPGAIIHGRVLDTSGKPIQGVRVTLTDQYGIPHDTVVTNASGYYSLYAVAGNDTVTLSSGSYNSLFMVDSTTLNTFNITISESQADRTSYTLTGQPTWNITHNFVLSTHSITGVAYLNLANTNFFIPNTDLSVNGTLIFYNKTFNNEVVVNTTSNGSYNIPDIAPYSYNVSAYVYGEFYGNITNVSVSSSQVSKDIAIPYGKLKLNISNNVQLGNVNYITLRRNNFTMNISTTATNETLNIPAGTYNLVARRGIYSDNITVKVPQNGNGSYTIQYTKYYNLKIETYINGQPIQSAIKYENEFNYSQSGVMFTNQAGVLSTNVTASVYSIYINAYYNGQHYSYIELLNISNNFNQSINLQQATLVRGTVAYSGQIAALSPIDIFNGSGLLQIVSNSSGFYSVYLPMGEYRFYSYFTLNSSLYVASDVYYVSGSIDNISLQGVPGYTYIGNVSYSGESVKGIAVAMVDNQPYFEYPVTTGKEYRLFLPNGVIPQYVNFISPGYSVSSINQNNVSLKLLPVSITLEMNYPGDHNITIIMSGPQNYEFNGTHTLNVYVLPGIYKISFRANNLSVTSSISEVGIQSALNGQLVSTSLTLKATLFVGTGGNIQIFNDSGMVSNSPLSMLPPGNYTLYEVSNGQAIIENIDLSGNTTLYPTLQQAYLVNINSDINSKVLINSQYGPIYWNQSQIYLPAGFYNFSVSSYVNSSFEYYASYSAYISSYSVINLNAALKELKSQVSLYPYLNGNIVSGAKYNLQGPENVSGILTNTPLSLKYGLYSLYVNYGHSAFIGYLNINSPKSTVNVTLKNAYPLSYGTFINNTTFNGNIIIKGEMNFLIPSSGVIYLPNGTYNFTGSAESLYYGNMNNYSFTQSVSINGISSATFNLNIIQVVKVNLISMAGSPTVAPNQNYSFPLMIQSNSNIPLTFTIENASNFKISGAHMTLLPHSSGIDTIYIQVPAGQPSGNYSLDIRVMYASTYQDVYVNVNVPTINNIQIAANDTSGQITNGAVKLPLKITNEGNSNTNVTVSILNSADLMKTGLNVTINGMNYYNITLKPSNFNNTTIVIKGSSVNEINGATIYVEISYLNYSKVIKVVPSLPALSIKYANVEGTGLENFSATVQNYYIYGFSAFIVLAVGISMILFRRRARA
jgi:dolichyl-diphosphooligosaccharide--protein glycosyltransferase